jgi:hypothetical protein
VHAGANAERSWRLQRAVMNALDGVPNEKLKAVLLKPLLT